MKSKLLIFLMVICFGCSKTTPRRPINPKPSATILSETLSQSIKLNTKEDKKIAAIIRKDSSNTYLMSSNGFWYTYIKKSKKNLVSPVEGDLVTIRYEISDLENNIIYSEEELGLKQYKVDKEDFISALQNGIKLMKLGETITFIIPSYNAFGILGDGNKIGINQSIKSTVTLININNKK